MHIIVVKMVNTIINIRVKTVIINRTEEESRNAPIAWINFTRNMSHL